MRRDERPATATVEAAREGDRKALDTLIAECLPLVYNVVGRAVDRHEDVDDVIQETMLRIVSGLVGPGGLDGPDGLRDPAGFRSWLVAVAMRHVRDRPRVRRASRASSRPPWPAS